MEGRGVDITIERQAWHGMGVPATSPPRPPFLSFFYLLFSFSPSVFVVRVEAQNRNHQHISLSFPRLVRPLGISSERRGVVFTPQVWAIQGAGIRIRLAAVLTG